MGRKKIYRTKKQLRDSKSRNTAKWKKEHTKSVSLLLNTVKDQDIIEYLATIDNKQQLLKTLIRNEMKK